MLDDGFASSSFGEPSALFALNVPVASDIFDFLHELDWRPWRSLSSGRRTEEHLRLFIAKLGAFKGQEPKIWFLNAWSLKLW